MGCLVMTCLRGYLISSLEGATALFLQQLLGASLLVLTCGVLVTEPGDFNGAGWRIVFISLGDG